MKSLRKISILLLGTILIVSSVSCSSVANKAQQSSAVHVRPASPEFQYAYLEALRQQNAGRFAAAFDLFSYCQQLDSLQPDPYYQLAGYYADLGRDSVSLAYLQKAVALNLANDAYHERLAQWLIQSRDYAKAVDAYEYLYSNNRSRSDVLEILLQLYQQDKNYSKMLETINRLEEVDGNSEDITLMKMRVYQLKGDKQAAYESLKNLSDEHPNDVNYKVMMGNWLLQNERFDEAREIFTQADIDEPNNEYVVASLYDFYRQQGDDSLAVVYRDRMLMNNHMASRTKQTLLRQVIADSESTDGDSIRVLDIFDRALASSPNDVDIAQLKAVYMTLKKMPEEEINQAHEAVLDIAPDNISSRLSLIQSYWGKQDWQAVIALCEPALQYNPEEIAFCYYLGLAHYQNDDNAKALEAFRRGVSLKNDKSDKALVSDFYVLMGDIYQKENRMDEAFAAYDSCLQWKPDNISCLNNYAYFISESDEPDLKRAETMSHRTVIAEPKNAIYLDTYAWILYKMERFLEAQQYIDQAIENLDPEQNNSTIFDHAGDIHLGCDDTEGALRLWNEALEQSEDPETIKKKIKKHEK